MEPELLEQLLGKLGEQEARIQKLEADRDRFLAALEQAAVMCLKLPMVAGIIPKEVKAKLQEIAKRAAPQA